jgi:hypothetical protein
MTLILVAIGSFVAGGVFATGSIYAFVRYVLSR